MATIPKTPHTYKPRRSRERIFESALKNIKRVLWWDTDDIRAALTIINVALALVEAAEREANTCEFCGHLGTATAPVVDNTEIIGSMGGGPFRHETLCSDRPGCLARQAGESKEGQANA
jgi:hypothetical protein